MNITFIRNIGYGGFSIVDLVRDDAGKEYARKTYEFNQQGDFSEAFKNKCKIRFKREAQFLEEMVHPNIVKILHKNLEHDPPYYLMPVAEAVLADELRVDETLGGNRITVIMDIIAAIEELHSISKFHRDLKPGNVLKFLDDEGNPYYAVSDYGLMRDNLTKNTILTTVETQKGSDDYTAPELSNDIRNGSAQSDIYSLGCILHDMYGIDPRTPFTEISENSEFGPVFRSCTKVNDDSRFDNVSDLRDEIMSIYESLGSEQSSSDEINRILEIQELDEKEAKFLAKYIDDNRGEDEGRYVLARINIAHIEKIYQLAPKRWRILAKNYCEWISNNSFNFELCDGYANRLLAFYKLGGLDIKVECIKALLCMGTSHNRYYVERKSVALIDNSMEENLARSLKVDYMTDKSGFLRIINRLKTSINYDIEKLHPLLRMAYIELSK
ncbi:protein kinase domain-containing protein [Maribacter forsetii]|uniref:protein kinase domain-containing protein n=1 Tax=Maribacter forsetii TaxID=444515 RepID=UPI00056ACCFB|nr:protein kinase [Maribacter forsetii]